MLLSSLVDQLQPSRSRVAQTVKSSRGALEYQHGSHPPQLARAPASRFQSMVPSRPLQTRCLLPQPLEERTQSNSQIALPLTAHKTSSTPARHSVMARLHPGELNL